MSTKDYIEGSGKWLAFGDFDFDKLQEPISKIHLCAVQSVPFCPPGVTPTNHWNACFELAKTSSSVRLDPSPGGDLGMTLILEALPGPHIDYPAHTVSIAVPKAVTLEKLLNVIVENKRDRYRFTELAEGCRYWLTVLVDDLNAHELISAEDKEIANRELAQFWKSPPGSGFSPKAVVQGTFTE